MIIDSTCAFTGHRPKSFPWGYDESAPGCVLLKEVLAVQISALAEQGVTDFLSGMAQGVDLWCAQIVLDLKKKNPALKLHANLPCEGQESKWTTTTQERYHTILAQANEVVCLGREYSRGCMLERNRYMVDHSSILLAVYNGAYRSGTGMTVRYAQQLKKELYILDPVTREITHKPANVDAVSSKKPVEIFPSMC